MPHSILRASTLMVSGVAIGVTIGAMCISTLPIWLGVATVLGLVVITLCAI